MQLFPEYSPVCAVDSTAYIAYCQAIVACARGSGEVEDGVQCRPVVSGPTGGGFGGVSSVVDGEVEDVGDLRGRGGACPVLCGPGEVFPGSSLGGSGDGLGECVGSSCRGVGGGVQQFAGVSCMFEGQRLHAGCVGDGRGGAGGRGASLVGARPESGGFVIGECGDGTSTVGVSSGGGVPATGGESSGGQRVGLRGPRGGLSYGRGPNYQRNQERRERQRAAKAGGADVPEWRRGAAPVAEKRGYFSSCSEEVQTQLRETRARLLIAKNKADCARAEAQLQRLESPIAAVQKVLAAVKLLEQDAKAKKDEAVMGWAKTVISSYAESVSAGAVSASSIGSGVGSSGKQSQVCSNTSVSASSSVSAKRDKLRKVFSFAALHAEPVEIYWVAEGLRTVEQIVDARSKVKRPLNYKDVVEDEILGRLDYQQVVAFESFLMKNNARLVPYDSYAP